MTLKTIKVPNDAIPAKALELALKNALNACAKGAQADFRTTTQTWTNKPEFQIKTPNPDTREVSTEDPIYKLVNEGTRPHIIRPRRARALTWMGTAYRAKTAPGVIGSKRGGNNNSIVYTKMVQHPGTQARKFDITIRDKWAKEMATRMQAAIIAALGGH